MEYAADPPFVSLRPDRPPPSFRVDHDEYVSYFVAIRPAHDNLHPFWLARALTNFNLDPRHVNSIQIQYWTLALGQHIDMKKYIGWDTKERNLWCEHRGFEPNLSYTDCKMTA